MNANLIKVVSIVCDNLTDSELVTLNLVAQLDQSPHNRIFDYKKVESLFTEQNGTRMHEETKIALTEIVILRLGG
jgi:hypothetical protein